MMSILILICSVNFQVFAEEPTSKEISGFVFVDSNYNNIKDDGEEVVPGVKITLYSVTKHHNTYDKEDIEKGGNLILALNNMINMQ